MILSVSLRTVSIFYFHRCHTTHYESHTPMYCNPQTGKRWNESNAVTEMTQLWDTGDWLHREHYCFKSARTANNWHHRPNLLHSIITTLTCIGVQHSTMKADVIKIYTDVYKRQDITLWRANLQNVQKLRSRCQSFRCWYRVTNYNN